MHSPLLLFLALVPQSDHRALHPADVPIYFALPDIQAYQQAFAGTAVGRAYAEPAIQVLVEGLEELSGADIKAGFDGLSPIPWGAAQGLLTGMTGASLSLSSLGNLEWISSAMEGEVSPELAQLELRIVADFQDEALAVVAFAAVMGAFVGLEEFSLEVRDEPKQDEAQTDSQQTQFYWAEWKVPHEVEYEPHEVLTLRREGSRVILFSGPSWRRGWRQTSPSPSTRVSPLGAAQGLVLVEAELREGLWAGVGPLAQALMPLAEGLLGPYITMLGQGGSWRIQLHEGRYLVDGLTPLSGAPVVFGGRPLAGEPFDLTHPEAAVAFTTSLDSAALTKVLRAAGLVVDGAEAFLGQLGDRVVISIPKGISVMSAPGVQLFVPLKSGSEAAEALEVWMGSLGVDWGGDLRLTTKAYRRQNLYTLEGLVLGGDGGENLPVDVGGMMRPTAAVMGDTLLVTLSATHAKRAIRALARAKGPLPKPLAGGNWPEGAVEVSHADWIQVLAGLYNSITGLASLVLAAAEQDQSEGRSFQDLLQKLPEAKVFVQHFAPALRWKTRSSAGVRYHSESSFGPEWSLLAMSGLGATLGLSQGD